MTLRVGSLCTGIRGLDLAVEQHFGAETVWYSEIEKALVPWLAEQMPGVPNLDDLKLVDWATAPTVEILTAGYPCQPFSHAGKRAGSDDPRHLWLYILDAVRHLRPRYVVLENVRGHLSMGFGDVLGSLAEAGFDAEWCVLRASDVGAPHQRARVFIVARDADRGGRDASGIAGVGRPLEGGRDHPRDPAAPQDTGADAAADARGQRHGGGQDGGEMGLVDREDAGKTRQRERPREIPFDRGAAAPAHPYSIGCEGPEPISQRDHSGGGTRPEWGVYEPAIKQWARVLGRVAPLPTDDAGRLNPSFVEWMMGYPEGWVADLGRTAALKALGNAVVPQQAQAALTELAVA